jgi:hypothetical protein
VARDALSLPKGVGAAAGCGRPRFDAAQRALSLPKGDIGLRRSR